MRPTPVSRQRLSIRGIANIRGRYPRAQMPSSFSMPEITAPDDCLEAEGVALLSRLRAEGYEGARLDASPPTRRLLAALAREGFRIRHSGRGHGVPGKTVVVEWEEPPGEFQYVAYEPNDMQRMDLLLGIPFLMPGGQARNRKTFGFDLAALADAAGVPLEHLRLTPENPRGQLKDGVEEQYLRVSDHNSALVLVRAVTAALCPSYAAPPLDLDDNLEKAALAELERRRAAIGPAMFKRVSDARRGQGRYRADLMRLFAGKCAVTGLGVREVLRASHSLAWFRCKSDEQRVDANNGLLLSANLDALYDRYLVTFTPSGAALVSASLSLEDQRQLGGIGNLRATPTAAQANYLELHVGEFMRREAQRKHGRAGVRAAFNVPVDGLLASES